MGYNDHNEVNVALYLGNDSEKGERVELKPDRLRTHAVVVGMTGSGKTGLGLVLLEELARQDVPIIAIDPKGDLTNLALLLPEFDAESFEPWVEDESEAEAIAHKWKNGIEKSGLSAKDVSALKEKCAFNLFTPGSKSGTPVDLLGAFKRPTGEIADDEEAVMSLVQSTVSGLLGLAGRKADPVRDPAHIVLSRIVGDAWAAGEDPDVETLILRLMDPPFEKVGVFALDKFFPPDERTDLGMALNAVMSSPSFANWQKGAPLDIEKLLRRGEKNQVSIFSIAHLDEIQRQFFLSILLGKLLAHSRMMPGTNDLRALIYFDEVAGYLPPHPHNPPTKRPLLTMMKQTRAVGVGVVLSTQNPVDLDYKALSNAGVWAIGRLQTKQDRDRVLKGMGRPDLDDAVESLKKREFVLFDAKEDEPALFKTRHAMCYLRGPLTRKEISRLNDSELVEKQALPEPAKQAPTTVETVRPDIYTSDGKAGLLKSPPGVGENTWFLDERVVFSKSVNEIFRPFEKPGRDDGAILYQPALYADLTLRFDEDRAGFVLDRRERRLWFPLVGNAPGEHIELPVPESALMQDPVEGARFEHLPTFADEEKELKALQKRVVDDIYRSESAGMFVQKKLKMNSRGDEDKHAFVERVRKAAQDDIDEKLAKLQESAQKKIDRLEDRLETERARLVDAQGALRSKQFEEVASIGETIFGMFSGRRRSTGVSKAVRKRGQSSRAKTKMQSIEDKIARYEEDLAELQIELEEKVDELRELEHQYVEDIGEKDVRLEKADIRLDRFGILWVPVSRRL